jgi:hypothetical protein
MVTNTAAATQIVTVLIYCHVAGVLNVPNFLSSGGGYPMHRQKCIQQILTNQINVFWGST